MFNRLFRYGMLMPTWQLTLTWRSGSNLCYLKSLSQPSSTSNTKLTKRTKCDTTKVCVNTGCIIVHLAGRPNKQKTKSRPVSLVGDKPAKF